MDAKQSVPNMAKFFGLPLNYDEVALKRAYKKLVLKYHPDVTQKVSDTPMFQLLTDMYRVLQEDLMCRAKDIQHNELKATFTKQAPPMQTPNVAKPGTGGNRKFDSKLFNRLFEEHRIRDVQDEGYEEWRKNPDSLLSKHNNTVVVYKEPMPIVSSIGKEEYQELGVSAIKDFTSKSSNPSYMDFRIAHTTTQLVDPDKIKLRKEYRTLQELETDRSGISFAMSDKERRTYEARKRKEAENEKRRLLELSKKDQTVMENYRKVHNTITHKLNH